MKMSSRHNNPIIPPPLFFLILFFSCQGLLPGGSCDIQLIEEICNKSSRDNPHLSYNFCAEAIEAVPESCHADLNGLGIISSKLALLNATHIQHLILELKNQTSDSNTSQALDQCLEVYSDAISDLEESINAFTFGSYDDANVFVSAAMTNSGDCEGGFQDKQVIFPFTVEYNDFLQLCSIALAITRLA